MNLIFVAILIILFSLQSLFGKLYNNNYPGKEELGPIVYSVFTGLVISFFTLLSNGFSFSPSRTTLILGLVQALILFGYNLSFLKASVSGPYSMVVISMLFGAIIIPMLNSTILFKEYLNVFQYSSIGLVLVSLVFLNYEDVKEGEVSKNFYWYCLALFFLNGLYGTLMDVQSTLMKGAESQEMIMITYFSMAILALLSLVFSLRKMKPEERKKDLRLNKKSLFFLAMVALVASVAHNLMMYTLARMNVSVMYTLNNGGVFLLSVLFSFIIFKEKLTKLKLIGIVMSLAGMIILSL